MEFGAALASFWWHHFYPGDLPCSSFGRNHEFQWYLPDRRSYARYISYSKTPTDGCRTARLRANHRC